MNDRDGVRSKAAIAGHPIHPMLIPFPIAFLVALPIVDVIFWRSGNDFWAQAAFWLVAVGLVSGLVAAVFGLIDFASIRRVREHRDAWIHAGGNVLAMVMTAINLWVRLDDPAAAILPAGMVLSFVVALTLGITGWYGGELAYRHRIGVTGDEPGRDETSQRPRGGHRKEIRSPIDRVLKSGRR